MAQCSHELEPLTFIPCFAEISISLRCLGRYVHMYRLFHVTNTVQYLTFKITLRYEVQ